MRKILKKLLSKFGYTITKRSNENVQANVNSDAFSIQKSLFADANGDLVIFDVGAYHGNIALEYNQLFPQSTIYCFEPYPDSFSKLEKVANSHSNVIAINKGLSASEGQSKFHINKSAPTNSLFKTYVPGKKIWNEGLLDTLGTVDVELTTIDSFVKTYGITAIDILKLDVQGAEYLVLEGAKEALENGMIMMIYTEIILVPTYEKQIPFEETIKLIKSYGFELYNFYNFSLSKEGRLRQLDAIFIKSQT